MRDYARALEDAVATQDPSLAYAARAIALIKVRTRPFRETTSSFTCYLNDLETVYSTA